MRQLKINKQITNRESQSLDKYLGDWQGGLAYCRPGSGVGPKRIKAAPDRPWKANKANLTCFVASVAKAGTKPGHHPDLSSMKGI